MDNKIDDFTIAYQYMSDKSTYFGQIYLKSRKSISRLIMEENQVVIFSVHTKVIFVSKYYYNRQAVCFFKNKEISFKGKGFFVKSLDNYIASISEI